MGHHGVWPRAEEVSEAKRPLQGRTVPALANDILCDDRSGRLLVARDEPRDAMSTLPGGGALDRPLLPAILADQGDRLPPAFSGAWAAAVGRAAVKSLALSAGAGDVMRGWRGG